jgi:hypothetical protein
MNDGKSPAAMQVHPSSYRDPSGFIFKSDGIFHRQVNLRFREHFDFFLSSGLYQALADRQWLVSHIELPVEAFPGNDAYKILRPAQIDLISYPYEWCFEMLKDAALLTLGLAKKALDHEMILKDATPYNIQWQDGKPIFIDTLSFEKYIAGTPWIAYRQFCECFLSPLLLMHYRKVSLHELQLAYPQGIPLQVAKKLLPVKSRFSILAYLHIHLHANVSAKPNREKDRKAALPKPKLVKLLASLEALVKSLSLNQTGTTWGNYYGEAALRNDYLEQKTKIIGSWITEPAGIRTAIDLGANEGNFAALLSDRGINTIAADADPAAVSKLYEQIRTAGTKHITPLIIDLANPSPAGGLNNTERTAFTDRVQDRDLGLCLALLHHLCIGRNIPFDRVAMMLRKICRQLVIEFVPRTDPMTALMLQGKPDIYEWYNEKNFLAGFAPYFSVVKKQIIPGTERVLFLMERR